MKANFQALTLKPGQCPDRKTRKPGEWHLTALKSKRFSGVACPRTGPPSLEGSAFAPSVIEKRSPCPVDPRLKHLLIQEFESTQEPA